MSTTAEHEGATDDVPEATEPAAPAPAPTPTFVRRARTVSHVLISSALAITLAAALAGSVEPRPGASFFTAEATTATQVSALSSTLGAGLDEDQQLDGAIEVLATANALSDGEVTAPVEQARAELGMLLATYLAQQDAARRVPVQVVPDGGLDLDESLDDAEVPDLPEPLDPGAGPDDAAVPGSPLGAPRRSRRRSTPRATRTWCAPPPPAPPRPRPRRAAPTRARRRARAGRRARRRRATRRRGRAPPAARRRPGTGRSPRTPCRLPTASPRESSTAPRATPPTRRLTAVTASTPRTTTTPTAT